jgi:EmrB/QacA subfamily drug resistance transporter
MSTSNRRSWLVLCICCMSLLIVGTDATIVNVALPAIKRDLNASLSGQQWSVDAYTLVIGSFLMAAGSTADRFGRRRVFQIGLALFTLGSLLCSLAWNVPALIAFRCVQALGGSMLNPVALSIISNIFTEPKARARAMGIWGAVFGVSLALGPVLGGLLVTDLSWRAIFWINIPIGVAAIILAQLFVPEFKGGTARRFDPWGQSLVIVTLASLTYGVIEGPSRGWGSPLIITMFAVAAAAAAGLVLVESRRYQPLLEVRFFRSVPFSGASVIAVLAFAILAGFLFLNTLYLQDGRGYSALHAGLLTLPMAAMIFIFAPISGRLVGSRGPRLPLVLAGIAGAVSLALLSQLSDTSSLAYLLTCYVLLGLSMGLVNAPISNTAVSGMPNSQAGVAASVASASRQTGSALGVAITGSIVAGASYSGLAAASHGAWVLLAACSAVIVVIGYVSTSRRAVATAERARGLDTRGVGASGQGASGQGASGSEAGGLGAQPVGSGGMLNDKSPGAPLASPGTGDPAGSAASAARGPEKEGAAP